MDTVGSPLASLLQQTGQSQAALARALGVGRTTVNNWTIQGVPAERVAAICDALNLSAPQAADFARQVSAPLPAAVEAVVRGAEGAGC